MPKNKSNNMIPVGVPSPSPETGNLAGCAQRLLIEDRKAVVDRIKKAYGLKTDAQLARALGVGTSTIAQAKKKQVPALWVLDAALSTGWDLGRLLNVKILSFVEHYGLDMEKLIKGLKVHLPNAMSITLIYDLQNDKDDATEELYCPVLIVEYSNEKFSVLISSVVCRDSQKDDDHYLIERIEMACEALNIDFYKAYGLNLLKIRPKNLATETDGQLINTIVKEILSKRMLVSHPFSRFGNKYIKDHMEFDFESASIISDVQRVVEVWEDIDLEAEERGLDLPGDKKRKIFVLIAELAEKRGEYRKELVHQVLELMA